MGYSNVIIIHFAPLELYPPVQNLIHELNKNIGSYKFVVLTTNPVNATLGKFKLASKQISLIRIGRSSAMLPGVVRYLNYLVFYLSSLLVLIVSRPKRVLYFETISSWPAYIYKRYFNRTCEILIHYHEYTSREEYGKGMMINKYFHGLEKQIYPEALWVSHTNHFRMEMFKADISPRLLKNPQIVPNYPPRSWNLSPRDFEGSPVRIVYVGSLSLSTMYTTYFSEWVISMQGRVTWDIYSHNLAADVINYFDKLNTPCINLKQAVPYSDLPTVLALYHVGVVLYNGHIANYVYNAPNKLFEYLACGLDVWFPQVMLGSLKYVRDNMLPKILAFDFENLPTLSLRVTSDRQHTVSAFTFFCEDALKPLIDKLINNDR